LWKDAENTAPISPTESTSTGQPTSTGTVKSSPIELIDNRKFPIVLGEKIGVRSSGRFPITLVQALPFPSVKNGCA